MDRRICSSSRSEKIIKHSRFISSVSPVFSKEDADEFISKVRFEFKDATHNVPAFIVGKSQQLKWSSDDKEPQGTAGMPVLNAIESNGLTDTVIVVTRYFGGTKLGTGGLVRAYSSSALDVIYKAGICEIITKKRFKIILDYHSFNVISHFNLPEGTEICDINYGENVSFSIDFLQDNEELLKGILNNISRGNLIVAGEEKIESKRQIALDKGI